MSQVIRNFQVSASDTIALTGDVTTTALQFYINEVTFIRNWVVQSTDLASLDGAPSYTVQISPDDDTNNFKDYDSLTNDVSINDSVTNDEYPMLFIRLVISVNDNTTGSCEFKLIQLT